MSEGWDKFIFYFENLGVDYFFDTAYHNNNSNATGFMSLTTNNFASVADGIVLSQMTHGWVGRSGEWAFQERNTLEHKIGMFLICEKYGMEIAEAIGNSNEARGLVFNDRQSGNILNAILGNGGTAFEWQDLRHNREGIKLWAGLSWIRIIARGQDPV